MVGLVSYPSCGEDLFLNLHIHLDAVRRSLPTATAEVHLGGEAMADLHISGSWLDTACRSHNPLYCRQD